MNKLSEKEKRITTAGTENKKASFREIRLPETTPKTKTVKKESGVGFSENFL
ncbi:hypothetical protein [Bergeyella sp. RCAD1439]|uniref:hypothetical protein n=1 Tax=Bergeyella anatis TaxID=3113737 RepID=UPI002E195934